MTASPRLRRAGAQVLGFALAVSLPAAAGAQRSAQDDERGDPIRCWWRTSAGAVVTGEPFDATLTCAVRDDDQQRVVPEEGRLAASAIQLAPFEILGGSHPADLRTGTHRFFQYHYSIRVIQRDLIGRDAQFPDIQIPYRVHTSAAGESVEGRDRTYLLPGQSIRVLSLVPTAADDIRDSGDASFAQVESLRFRARALGLVALALGALGALLLVPSIVKLARRGTRPETTGAGGLPPRRVLARVTRELDDIARERRGGWTPDLTVRAASALRLAACCALKRACSLQPHTPGNATPDGRLLVRRGLVRRSAATIASAVTAADVGKKIASLPLTTPAEDRQLLEDLHRALATLTASAYRSSFEADDPALDEALEVGLQSARRLKRAHAWPRTLFSVRADGERVEARA